VEERVPIEPRLIHPSGASVVRTDQPLLAASVVAPDVRLATILPTCDGNVSDLQGQAYVDASCHRTHFALLSLPYVAITTTSILNDNWLENTDPGCGSDGGSLRLTPKGSRLYIVLNQHLKLDK
jgi:hypothetical protein